jgi:hypothetical protein
MGHASMRAALIISTQPASGIERLRLRLMSGSDAAVTANGPLMARDARISQRARGVGGTIGPLTRAFAVERVTRIELAWPAWKVAVTVRTCAISEGGVCSGDTVNDRT